MIDIKRNRQIAIIAEEWLCCVRTFFIDEKRPYLTKNKKRIYFKSYKEKLYYECRHVVNKYAKNKKHKKVCFEKLKYWWENLDNIILASPDKLDELVMKWDRKKCGEIILQRELGKTFISYYELISKKHGLDLVKMLNIKTCPYCNRQFIHTFKGRTFERPELDHFYPKSKYPLLCLSFYNLIPTCHFCNHIKSEEKIGLNPYLRAFSRKFIITDKRGTKLSIIKMFSLTEKDIELDFEGTSQEEKKNIDTLGLKDAYNKHTDFVKELIDKSIAYDAYARQVLIDSFQCAGYNQRQVYDFVWGRYLIDAKYEDKPLSKLTKDILDLLGIKR